VFEVSFPNFQRRLSPRDGRDCDETHVDATAPGRVFGPLSHLEAAISVHPPATGGGTGQLFSAVSVTYVGKMRHLEAKFGLLSAKIRPEMMDSVLLFSEITIGIAPIASR
jgi:hypothetical protein